MHQLSHFSHFNRGSLFHLQYRNNDRYRKNSVISPSAARFSAKIRPIVIAAALMILSAYPYNFIWFFFFSIVPLLSLYSILYGRTRQEFLLPFYDGSDRHGSLHTAHILSVCRDKMNRAEYIPSAYSGFRSAPVRNRYHENRVHDRSAPYMVTS